MITLYHGSNVEIDNVDLLRCRPNKDFGQGFYLTTIYEQAQKMAQRVANMYGSIPCVTQFCLDEGIFSDDSIAVRVFAAPSKEWALFVINNRNPRLKSYDSLECNQDKKYDLVIGPVADDDLSLLFRQFSSGLIGVETLIRAMKYKKLTNQYSIHTEAALKYLQKVGVAND